MFVEKVTNKENYQNNDRVLLPLADIYESPDLYTLKLEMPGVTKDKLEISVENNELEIKGVVNVLKPDNMELKYSEFFQYDYFRKFSVGNDIDRSKIEATFDNGVLTLVLHKLEAVKPRKITINAH